MIGNGTWVGNGAKIIGPGRIGRNCVVGANAFINRDVPDYSMIVGVPGRIVKRFDTESQKWVAVSASEGSASAVPVIGSARADEPTLIA